MKIKIKVGNVEVLYEKESFQNDADAAVCGENWTSSAKTSILISTMKEMAEIAKDLYDKQHGY